MASHGEVASHADDAGEEDLFRRAALAAFGERHYGRPLAEMPRLWLILGGVLLAMVAAAFLLTASYARKERVTGWLVPDAGLVRLTAGRHAQVERVATEEGDRVRAGDVLVVLSTDTGLAGGGRATEALMAGLDREAAEAERQLALLDDAAVLDAEASAEAIDRLGVERARLDDQLAAQEQRLAISADVVARFEGALADDAASVVEVARQREAHAVQVQAREALRQRRATLDRQLAELAARRPRRACRGRTPPLRAARAPGRHRAAAHGAGPAGAHRADRPGGRPRRRAVGGAGRHGHARRAARQLGAGRQRALRAGLRAESRRRLRRARPARAADVPGVPAPALRQRVGPIERVSSAVLQPEEGPAAAGMDEPAYKARVRLDRQQVDAFGRRFDLRPGMAFTAEVIQERRTLAQLLMEPLRAGREAVPEESVPTAPADVVVAEADAPRRRGLR